MPKTSATLWVEPINGLANRMGFLDSAMALSKTVGARLCVLWYGDSMLNSRFTDLFERPEGIERLIQLRLGVATRFVRSAVRLAISKVTSFYADPEIIRDQMNAKRDFATLIRPTVTYLWDTASFTPSRILSPPFGR